MDLACNLHGAALEPDLDNSSLMTYPWDMIPWSAANMLMTKPVLHLALVAAKARWAAAQDHHALRGTPSHEMTKKRDLGAKPLGASVTKELV